MSCWSDHSIIWFMSVLPNHLNIILLEHLYIITDWMHNLLVSRILLLLFVWDLCIATSIYRNLKKCLCLIFLSSPLKLQTTKRLIYKCYLFRNYIAFLIFVSAKSKTIRNAWRYQRSTNEKEATIMIWQRLHCFVWTAS